MGSGNYLLDSYEEDEAYFEGLERAEAAFEAACNRADELEDERGMEE